MEVSSQGQVFQWIVNPYFEDTNKTRNAVHSEHMPFKCDFCHRLFKHKRSRDRHVKLHTGDRKYRCGQCEAAFSRSDHLKIHMKTHDNAKPYQCTVCNRGYNTAAALTSHMQNHKKESPTAVPAYKCLQCSAGFATSKELQMHVPTHDSETQTVDKTLPCNFCSEYFGGAEALKEHVEQKHAPETQGKCPECPDTFSSLEALLQHKKVHEDSMSTCDVVGRDSRFSCGFCTKKEFPTVDSLQKHMQERHVPMCNSMESSTTLASSSSPMSIQRVTPDTPSRKPNSPVGASYGCEYCTMKFTSVPLLQKHTLDVHSFGDVSMGNVYCSQCSKCFPNESVLMEHVKAIHEREKRPRSKNSSPRQVVMPNGPFYNGIGLPIANPETLLCSQCNAALPNFESFRAHLQMHLEPMSLKYDCYECDGQFPTEERLDVHISKHYLSVSTEYGCPSCMKMFNKPDHLQRHLLESHAHQLYQCAICKEIFESKVDMQLHFTMKHSNACHLYKCTSCNSMFRSEIEFRVHVKMVHLPKIQSFRCPLCNLCFPSDSVLQIHFQSHKKFSCMYCPEEFPVEFLLDRHIQDKHSGDNLLSLPHNEGESAQNLSIKTNSRADSDSSFGSPAKRIRCDMCDTSFNCEPSLNVHRRQVHNIRTSGSQKSGQTTLSLFCAYCNESCKSRTELENHMKTHVVSPSKHKCNICDEVCPSAGTLAEHKLAHCKVVTDSTCVTCHTALKLEEHFLAHLHQHNPQGLPAPCVICRQTLMSEVEVQVHAKHHLKSTDFLHVCCVCQKTNSLQQLIITGTMDSHTYMCKDCYHLKRDDLRCFECNVKFENDVELEKHRLCHRKTYQCIKCQISFETEVEIQEHVKTHVLQEGIHHVCHICKKVFDSPAKLQCHLIEHTYEGSSSYRCYLCNASFTSSHLIQQHMLEHRLDARPYDCEHCPQKFFFRAELDNHAFIHLVSTKDNGIFQCVECLQTFASAQHFEAHSKTHQSKLTNDTFKCSICPEVFNSSVDMQQHHFRAHSDSDLSDGKKSFPCTECDKVFPCISNLQGHLRIHAQGSKFTCPKCNKDFALSKNLNIHMRSHNGIKPYKCHFCDKGFSRKENRKAHLKSHTGQKPFMCPHCGKTFSRKCHVKEHMRIHITSTTHPCEMCTETFPSIAELKRHLVETHNKVFDYSCSVCEEVFASSDSLDQHMVKEHDVRTNSCDSSPMEEMSESSLGQTSSSIDSKDLDNSECSSVMEEDSDTGESPLSIVEEPIENQIPTSQVVA
ncbi:hypothetical protein JTE90_016046 [Oedothorax gibbosus]|uniref:C2H2-type domain-containing protein n=1 Tax=Oedothorax gibbosus TaxID=931172 RepID=A0AAV6U5V6_9ARAC|nr:hypothetical protein JTE90_016046 [Oedothorax gibbosus]